MRRFTTTTCALALAAAGLIAASTGTAQASTCSHARLPLLDSSCTPGAYNPDVTQSNIHSTICVSGWTATVRPPTSGFVGEFRERLLLSGANAWFHGRVMSLSFENAQVLASGPWLCCARRGGPGAAELQGRSVRGDPP
ncbi:hypothetical protein ABZ468_25155 [Streptomyces sp. NPDC005708]|uniref:hypothetical protein n=1 Tax=Streptomyces sp. NPDC005708 TaxID=3154564 RepID=UPI0033CC8124